MAFQLWLEDWTKPDWKIKVSVADSEEEFKNTTVKELKRKLLSEDEYQNCILAYYCTTLKKNHTLGSYGIKHEDIIVKVPRGATYTVRCYVETCSLSLTHPESSEGTWSEVTRSFEDDDDKEMPRTQSMDNVALMRTINPSQQ